MSSGGGDATATNDLTKDIYDPETSETDSSMDAEDNDEVLNASSLTPKLNSIFAEVEKNLPTIDFECMDPPSSDDEVSIFQRNLEIPSLDEVKHLEDSLGSSGTWEDFMNENPQNLISLMKPPTSTGKKVKLSSLLKKETASSPVSPVVNQTKIGQSYNNELTDEALEELTSEARKKNIPEEFLDHINEALKDPSNNTQPNSSIKSTHSSVSLESSNSDVSLESLHSDLSSESTSSAQFKSNSKEKHFDENEKDVDEAEIISDKSFTSSSTQIDETIDESNMDVDEVDDEADKAIQCGLVEEPDNNRVISTNQLTVQQRSAEVVSKFISSDAPRLLLSTDLSNLTIDDIMDTLNETQVNQQRAAPPPILNTDASDQSQDSLLMKLAQLSNVEDINPETGAIMKKRRNSNSMNQRNAASSATTCSRGISTASTAAGHPAPKVNRSNESAVADTVYLDLRGYDEEQRRQRQSIQAVQRILKIPSGDSSSDDSDGEEQILWHEQRRRIKMGLKMAATPPSPPVSNAGASIEPASTVSMGTSTTQPIARATDVQNPKSKKQDSTVPSQQQVKGQSVCQTEHPQPDNKEKERKMEIVRKVRQQKEQERQSRMRLGKHLEALRPQSSSKGHMTYSEATPTLFDMEASYEPSPLTLPSKLNNDNNELVLLSVQMSALGEMLSHSGPGKRTIDPGCCFSASYTALLSWLLFLVPDWINGCMNDLEYLPVGTVPFRVVGLQQMYTDDELCLYIAVCPEKGLDIQDLLKTKKAKKRVESKDCSAFQLLMSKFLATNTLHSVSPWLQNLVSLDVTSQQLDPEKQFVYRPPLPSITTKPLSTFIKMHYDQNAVKKMFSLSAAFFWQTVESDETLIEMELNDTSVNYETQNTMSLVYKKVFRDPHAIMGILNRILQEGLDLSGVRLLYPTEKLMSMAGNSSTLGPANANCPVDIGPILALAIRGTFARTIWLDAVGPSDPVLARRTDPQSLVALYGGEERGECLLFCPRNPSRVLSELCRWFGGRVPANGVIDIGKNGSKTSGLKSGAGKKNKRSAGIKHDLEDISPARPASMLNAMTTGTIFLSISPAIPIRCLGLILASCQRRGFQLRGIQRMHLTGKKATLLGMKSEAVANIKIGSLNTDHDQLSTILLLSKENALHNSASLVESLMVQLSLLNLLAPIQDKLKQNLRSDLLFHVTPFSEGQFRNLGGDFSKLSEADLYTPPGYITPQLFTNPELEQIVILSLTGHQCMKSFGIFLGKLLGVVPFSRQQSNQNLPECFELLGIKWLSSLRVSHAKTLTPYEVGDPEWRSSITTLTSEPAIILALRGINAFKRVSFIVSTRQKSTSSRNEMPLDMLMSPTPELAYQLARTFFTDKDLHSDHSVRSLLPYLPPDYRDSQEEDGSSGETYHCGSIFQTMLAGPQRIPTLLVCKPGIVVRHLGKLLKRISQEGFAIVGVKLLVLTPEMRKYIIPDQDPTLYESHDEYLSSGPCLLLVLYRENAVKKCLDLIGPEDPREARRLNPQHWRALFGNDIISNGLYVSESYKKAITDVKFFFPEGLCCKPDKNLIRENIKSPAEDHVVDMSRVPKRAITYMSSQSSKVTDRLEAVLSGKKTSPTEDVNLTPITSLTQTTCIVLTPGVCNLSSRGKQAAFVDIVDSLQLHGFMIVGSRMVWLRENQAEVFLRLNEAGSFKHISNLTSGGSLVLALQRDNAVLSFDALLGGLYDKHSLISKHNENIMRPKTTKQAGQLLAFFFDELIPGAHAHVQNS